MGDQPQRAIDDSVPHQARVWNVFLDGKDHYPVDREYARQILSVYPAMQDIALHARAFLGRAVRHLVTEAGIRQFLDIGTGLPTADNTHEVAQRVDPSCRIVYVDNDPLVMTYAQALLTSTPEGVCKYIEADARDPRSILVEAAKTLDFTEPVALMMLGVLGTIADDEQANAIVRELLDALSPGSYLVIEDGTKVVEPEAASEAEHVRDNEGGYDYTLRTPEQITRFFEGLELAEPGVVSVAHWRPEPSPWGLPDAVDAFCAVAKKP